MSKNSQAEKDLARRLAVLREQPPRDPRNAARGRAQFMAQAEELAAARKGSAAIAFPSGPRFDAESDRKTVSDNGKVRHNRWMHPLQSIFTSPKKERSPMFSAIGTVVLIISLVLGGTGATVVAAQDSLPDQGLYGVKTWSEEVRAGLTTNEQARLELALEMTGRRAEEMQVMLRAGKTPPEAVQTRMQEQAELALRLAAGMPDEAVPGALEQIRTRLNEMDQAFLGLGPQTDPQAEALLERVHKQLRDQLKLCEDGLLDPQRLRDQLRERDRLQDPDQTQDQTQNQTQDQTQDQDQDRDQDQTQDRLHQGDQEQDQTQDQTQDRLHQGDQTQDQTRDQLHQDSQEQQQDQTQTQTQEQLQQGSPTSGNPDSGTPGSGNPDSGNPDSGNPDGGNPDSGSGTEKGSGGH